MGIKKSAGRGGFGFQTPAPLGEEEDIHHGEHGEEGLCIWARKEENIRFEI